MLTIRAQQIVNAGATAGPAEIRVSGGRIAEVVPVGRGHLSSDHSNPAPADGSPHFRDARDGNDAALSCVYAVPGLIDMHTHGGAGHDIMDATDAAHAAIARHHLTSGTTSFLGSTLTAPLEELQTLLSRIESFRAHNADAATAGEEASLLGVHLEGPWVSPGHAGAQNPDYIREPDEASLQMVKRHAELVRMVTFSYHWPGAREFLGQLVDLGIIPACGHDSTLEEEFLEAVGMGLRHLTHIYSMSSSFQRVAGRKHLGSLEMGLMTPGVTVEVIADGHHITRHFWDFVRHNKDVSDIILVSDSMRCAGMGTALDGVTRLGELEVIVDDGVAWLADRSAYAGSITSMHDMFRRVVREWGVPMEDAVRMTSWNQAAELKLAGRLGSIEPGKDADIVLLDHDLEIVAVIKSGRPVKPTESHAGC